MSYPLQLLRPTERPELNEKQTDIRYRCRNSRQKLATGLKIATAKKARRQNLKFVLNMSHQIA